MCLESAGVIFVAEGFFPNHLQSLCVRGNDLRFDLILLTLGLWGWFPFRRATERRNLQILIELTAQICTDAKPDYNSVSTINLTVRTCVDIDCPKTYLDHIDVSMPNFPKSPRISRKIMDTR